MQFSDTGTSLGLIQDITFLLGGVDTVAYPTADRTRNVNERYRQVWAAIFDAYGGWLFQDDNVSGVPYAEQALTSGTGVYGLPSGALTVNMVEVKIPGGTTYAPPLRPITLEEFKKLGGDQYLISNAQPLYYMLYEDYVQIIPTPNYSVASTGIRIYFDRDISQFAASDTTKVPGFSVTFHRALSVGAALDYAMMAGTASQITSLTNQWQWYMGNPERLHQQPGEIRRFYAQRWKDRNPARLSFGGDLMDEMT